MCAIVGIYGMIMQQVSFNCFFSMQHRGQEATGISSSCDGKFIQKNRGLVSSF